MDKAEQAVIGRVRELFGPEAGRAAAFRDVIIVRERNAIMRWLTGKQYKVETVPFVVMHKFSVAETEPSDDLRR